MYNTNKTINGTFGEVWIDDYYLAEVTGLQAKVNLKKDSVNQTGTLVEGYKVTGMECKGTLKCNKVTSYFIKLLSKNLQKGKETVCTIISKLDDPESSGTERIKFTGVTFDELTLADWEAKKLGEESIPFTFTGWKLLDTIKPM